MGGRDVGLIAVAVLALSVWEIEIGRFGRMYAPFQALFAWYIVFFQLPFLPELVGRTATRNPGLWARALHRLEGADADDVWPAPTFGAD